MKRTCLNVWVAMLMGSFAVQAIDSLEVKKLFANPPREYSSAPLWVWNDMLTEWQVMETMHDLAKQQVKQVFIHPRPGLMTPYLSEEWFKLWRTALAEAELLDMNVWIYDENSYPSGFAGGWVPELMPESRGRGLSLREVKTIPAWTNSNLAVFEIAGATAKDITAAAREGTVKSPGRYVVASVVRAAARPWTANRYYVDLLYPGVTEKFLEVTMDAYKREVGSQFGKRLPGVFTDEPQLRPAGGFPWTDSLPESFQKRWGYNLLDNLPSLSLPVGDWRKVRYHYYQLVHELFVHRWAKPYYDYCEKNKLEFTGHYWEHEWPNCISVPDNMGMYAWFQRPAIDILMNQYKENDRGAQFGNVRSVKELSSVANQLGLKRTLCEAYGAGGWDLRFEDMKRIGDWLYVLGVNTMDQHLSYITIRGARKRDHPQSFSYHEPWWDCYRTSAAYFERLSAAMSQGEQVNRILILEPTTTAWMYNGEGKAQPQLVELGDSFQKLVQALEVAQVEYDLGSEDIIRNRGQVQGKAFIVGQRAYHTVVLPANTENLNGATLQLLETFTKAGGSVVYCSAPTFVDGVASNRGTKLVQNLNCRQVNGADLVKTLAALEAPDNFMIHRQAGDEGILFHHRRQLADGQLVMLVNTSLEKSSVGIVQVELKGVEKWDLETGQTSPYAFEKTKDGVRASFNLPPAGSQLLFFSKSSRKPLVVQTVAESVVEPVGGIKVNREEPNLLVLDYVDVQAGGESLNNTYFYPAQQFVFQKFGFEKNPWDSAVQFKDEIIRKTFTDKGGFEASYRFTVEGSVPEQMFIVIERPDLYIVSCNGEPVGAKRDSWWLDRAFGKIDIRSVAKVGENVIKLRALEFTVFHELESAYLLGSFTLKALDKGFVVVPDKTLLLGKWNEQGHPFYSAGVAYQRSFNVSAPAGQYVVRLPQWLGSVAKVKVNGKLAGHIAYAPWQCDVSSLLKPGENQIEVVVIGTLKNALGPHHNQPMLGTAWPAMFQKAPKQGPPPGAEYSTVGYGLFEPFTLVKVK